MTVSTSGNITTHACNGVTVAFATGFPFMESAHLIVTRVTIATGVRTLLTLGTHYTVSGASASAGGTVTTMGAGSPLSALYQLEIKRATGVVQPADFVANDGADAETIEDGFDRLTMICQEMQAVIVEIIDIVGGGGSGRATVSNIAGPGIGWYSQQVGTDFQFKKLNPAGDFPHYPTGESGLVYTDSSSVATLNVGGPHRMLVAELNPAAAYRVRFDEIGQHVLWTTGTDPDLKHWGWAAAGDGGLALYPLQDTFEAIGSTFLWLQRDALGEFTGMNLVGVPLTISDAPITFAGGAAAKLDMGGHDIVNIGAIAFSSLALTGTLSVAGTSTFGGLVVANAGINVNNSTGILMTGASITFAGAASGKLDMGGHDIINIGAIAFSSLALTGTLSVAGATTLSTVSASGLVSANAGVTVAGGPLTMNGQSITFTGALTGKLDMGGHDIINIGAFALTSLSLSGTLGVTGAATFGSTVTATGLVSANGGLAVTGTSSHSGAATFGSTVAATGLVSANGGLAVTGAASVSGTATLGAATITGAATVGGTLGVTGATTVSTLTASGLVTANLGVTVNGAALTMNSQPITFAGTSAAKLDMGGHDIINVGAFALSSLTLSGALTVGGLVTANAGLAVTGAATFSSTASFGGLVSANAGLAVTGAASVSGTATLGAAVITGTASVGGLLTASAGLAVTGAASVSGTATLGAASITGTSSHGGAATFASTASFAGLVSANLGLTVAGAALTMNGQSLTFTGAASAKLDMNGHDIINVGAFALTSLTLSGALTVGGLVTANAGLAVTGAATFSSTASFGGLLTASAGLAVTGAASVSGTATMNAAVITTTASVGGLLSANGGLSTTTIAASGLISANAGITVTGTASVSSTMTVAGLLTLSNGLDVTGDVAVSGELDVQGEIFGRAGATFDVGPVIVSDGSLHLLGTGIFLNMAGNRIADAAVISHKETAKGTTGGAVTFDFSGTGVASYNITLNAASTWTFTAPTFGAATTYIECTQDGTGSRVVTLPAVCKFTAGTAAADKLASTGAGKRDLYVFRWNQTATACLTQIFKDW